MPALDGIRILDLTQFEAGPACSQALAWLGADVVKIEKPGRGDRARGPDTGNNQAYAPLFCAWNANKRSLALDIGCEAGHALFLRLLTKFDVLVENFGPGVAERLNIGYETLKAHNPRLIYASIKGFGKSGPYADFAVQQPISQAAAGAFSINGEPDGPPMMPASMGDSGAGVVAAVAVLTAYAQRLRTGKGQLLDLSMQEAMTFFVRGRSALGARWGNRAARRKGNAGDVPPGDLYPCKPFGRNDYICFMPITERHWESLCAAMGRPELRKDPRFHSPMWRIRNQRALREEISSWTSSHTKSEALAILGAAGIPCGACLDTNEVLSDAHLIERGFIQELDLPVHGKVKMPGFAPRLSESQVPITRPPRLGEHTNELLRTELALTDAELEAMQIAGVTGAAAQSD